MIKIKPISSVMVTENCKFMGEERLGFVINPEPKSMPEAMDHAVLFRTAPEMLEALKIARIRILGYLGVSYSESLNKDLVLIEDVIIKAGG